MRLNQLPYRGFDEKDVDTSCFFCYLGRVLCLNDIVNYNYIIRDFAENRFLCKQMGGIFIL